MPKYFVQYVFIILTHTFTKFFMRKYMPKFEATFSETLQRDIFGNRVKGRISERVFQENKALQIFWRKKKNISYPLIRTRTFVRING